MSDACSSDFLAVLDVVPDELLELRDLLAGGGMDSCGGIVDLLVGVLDSLTPILEKSLLLSQSANLRGFFTLFGLLVDLPDAAPISLGVLDEDLIRDVMKKVEQSVIFVLILSEWRAYSEGDVFVYRGICYYVEFPLDFLLEVAVGFGFHLGTDKYRIINLNQRSSF